ncbi:MAG: STAS domain-containing protein [Ignavibacteriae bacterium]|nr:STAS domain-containing protein [Ignavibacteriota bacterium]
MELTIRNFRDDIRLIELRGRLDLKGTLGIEKLFSLHTLGSPQGKVIVDLQKLEFLTSAGICMLVRNARELNERKGRMVLIHASSMIEDVLRVAHVDSLLPHTQSIESAVRYLDT